MTEANNSKLDEVFRAVFDLPDDADLDVLRRGEEGVWTSLTHVELMTAIGSEFDVEITVVDSLDVTSFATAAELIEDLLDD